MSTTDLQTLAKKVGDDWIGGRYYDDAERDMATQWKNVIWPLIEGSDFTQVLDLAAGHGRNTARLLDHAERLTAVDINQSNVDVLSERFRDRNNLEIVRNNGSDLRDVAGSSITFLYSFDAMVHFDSDIIRAYVKEFRRVMRPGARGFCHYSNNYHNPTGSYVDHPGWRNFMSRQLFEHWLTKQGFRVLKSRYLKGVLDTIEREDGECDAMTLFELPVNAEPMGDFLAWELGSVDGTGQGPSEGLRTEFERLNGEISGLTRQVALLEENLEFLRGENAGLRGHAKNLEQISRDLRQEVRGLTEYNEHLLVQIDGLKTHSEGLEKIRLELQDGVRSLEEYKNDLIAQSADAKRHAESLEQMNHELSHELREISEHRNLLLAGAGLQVDGHHGA
jgi:ubiquinone/menaquinone biosynthesis C-methylase UbiE